MNPPIKAGKRIVSRGMFFRAVLHQLCIVATGFVGIIIGAVFCGGIPVCLFYILREFHFNDLLAVGTFLLVLLSVFIGLRIIRKSEQRIYAAQDMDTGVLLTRANVVDLPAPESLVRASEQPSAALETVLVRPSVQAPETPPEQLVRAAGAYE